GPRLRGRALPLSTFLSYVGDGEAAHIVVPLDHRSTPRAAASRPPDPFMPFPRSHPSPSSPSDNGLFHEMLGHLLPGFQQWRANAQSWPARSTSASWTTVDGHARGKSWRSKFAGSTSYLTDDEATKHRSRSGGPSCKPALRHLLSSPPCSFGPFVRWSWSA